MRRSLLVMAGIAAAASLVWTVPGYQYDFSFDWITGAAVLEGVSPHLPIKDVADSLGLSARVPTAHPRLPGALMLNALFALVPWQFMYEFGRLLTVGSAGWMAWMFGRWLNQPQERMMLLLPLGLLVWPFSAMLEVSQWAVFAVVVLIGLTLFGGGRWWSGIPLALAVTLKAWPWLLVPALWLSGRRKVAYGAVGFFVGLNALPLLMPHVSMSGTISAFMSIPGMEGPVNVSPVQWLPLWAGPLVGLTAVMLLRDRVKWAIPAGLLASPVLWAGWLISLLLLLPRVGQEEADLFPSGEAIQALRSDS